MRISTTMQFTNHLKYLNQANYNLDKASERYNTGQKFSTSGEDPSGMATKVKYTGDISAFNQYKVNAGVVAGYLSEEETALGSAWDALGSARTRIQQAVNGSMDSTSLTAIAEDLEQLQAQLFDIMNTKSAEGEYIFAGSNSSRPAFTKTSDGRYTCQADGLTRSVQVSPTILVQSNDSGLNIFQNVPLAYEQTTTGTPAIQGSFIKSYDDFSDLFEDTYSSKTGANNNLTIDVTAGNPGTFTVKDGNGVEIGKGEVTEDNRIEFKGLEFDLGPNYTGSINVKLEQPKKDNILNVLQDTINILRDPNISTKERTQALVQAEASIENAMANVDMYRGQVGARQANIDHIIASNESMSVVKQTARAEVVEVDAFTAVSDMLMQQNALQVAQQTYSIVHGTSLFDYLR